MQKNVRRAKKMEPLELSENFDTYLEIVILNAALS